MKIFRGPNGLSDSPEQAFINGVMDAASVGFFVLAAIMIFVR